VPSVARRPVKNSAISRYSVHVSGGVSSRPRIGWRQLATVTLAEILAVDRILEQILAIVALEQVAIHGHGDPLAVPGHQPFAVGGMDIVECLAADQFGRHLGKIREEIAGPGRRI